LHPDASVTVDDVPLAALHILPASPLSPLPILAASEVAHVVIGSLSLS
jgi:hypothetical protein